MGHPPQAVWLPARGLAHLAPAVERIRAHHGTTPDELAVVLRARPRGTEVGQLAAIAWVLDAARSQVLLVDHRQHGWSCPGGHVETREEPAATAARELSEGTGLRLTPDRLDPVTVSRASSAADDHGPAHDHWILGYLFTSEPTAVRSRELDATAWHRVDALPPGCVDGLAPLLSALLADPEIHLWAGT
jgi:ADP-ribose pyrophosphatase YjhB (NUDIX family)